MNETVALILASSLGGLAGVVFKGLFDWLRARSHSNVTWQVKQMEAAEALREELHTEVLKLREELREVKGEVNRWREEYYTVLQENIQLKSDVQRIEAEYKQEISELREEIRRRDKIIESLRERLRKLEGKNGLQAEDEDEQL